MYKVRDRFKPLERHPKWKDVPDSEWNDWMWQQRHRVRTLEGLKEIIELTPDEETAFENSKDKFHVSITPYYASLIDPKDPKCPIRLQAVPQLGELTVLPQDMEDPLGEEQDMPVPGITHRYPDRVLFYTTHNCFAGETKILTKEFGWTEIANHVGTEVSILTEKGFWKKAPILSFGKQEIVELHLTRKRNKKIIRTTANHRWPIFENQRSNKLKTVTTEDLKTGDAIPVVLPKLLNKEENLSIQGIQRGIVFGDGTVDQDNAKVVLVDEKKELLKYFPKCKTRKEGDNTAVLNLPFYYKQELPSITESKNYLLGFLAGLIATDGSVYKNVITITNKNKGILEHIKNIASIVGLYVSNFGECELTSNLSDNEETHTIWGLTIGSSNFPEHLILRTAHKKQFEKKTAKRSSWVVEKVVFTGIKETVYCPKVPTKTEMFVIDNNILTLNCAMYCRHCTRKRKVSDPGTTATKEQLRVGLEYIARTPAVRDVVISGGDPLSLSDTNIEYILNGLRNIPHIEMFRLGTRNMVTLPARVTDAFVEMVKKYHPVYVNTHFNHPKELTQEAFDACEKLANAGCVIGNQMVLLKGVNDDPALVKELNHKLLMARVRPYLIYYCDLSQGISHFRTTYEKGLEIIENLRGHTSGLAVPHLVIDAPGGGGKIPVLPNYVKSYDGEKIVLRNYKNKDEYTYWFGKE